MASRAAHIIKTLYGEELDPPANRGLLGRLRSRNGAPGGATVLNPTKCPYKVLRRRRRLWVSFLVTLIVAGVAGFAVFFTGVYYFNVLTRLEQDVFKGQARIDSLLQRRRNISTNLARTVRDYAIHEQGVFSHVSNMRATAQGADEPANPDARPEIEEAIPTSAPDALPEQKNPPPPNELKRVTKGGKKSLLEEVMSLVDGSSAQGIDLGKKIGGLLAISEQYPDLKLSQNFQRFMDALVETEKALSDERITYSETVNTYTTQLKSLPGRWFGRLYGFSPLPYYQADDGAKRFVPVEY